MRLRDAAIYVGDYGFAIQLRIVRDGQAQDVSAFTTLQYIFRKPDGTSEAVPASFASDGTDGRLRCIVGSGLFDAAGWWHVQARISKVGAVDTSKELRFFVREPLDG